MLSKSSVGVKAAAVLLSVLSLGICEEIGATCCSSLAAIGLENRILYPGSKLYDERQATYFSLNEEISPQCILQPQNTKEVSVVVKALVATKQCRFAIRSGGHHHAIGSNNIHNGVTIDLGRMNKVTYNPQTSTTAVQPGALWGDVYRTLDPLGLTVAGGRDVSVGVAGLILGGGNSFYSALRGMVCDGVRRFEVVLSNGDIVVADHQTNSDLFRALKGGGSNFGIVTEFELDTFETGKLWGGIVYYPWNSGSELVDAFVRFGDNIDENPASSTILFWTYQPAVKDTLIGASFVNIDGIVMDAPHNDFWAIQPNVSSTMRLTNITDLAIELDFPGEVYRNVEFTLTIQNDARVINKAIELHNQIVDEMKSESDTGDFISVLILQPLAPSYGARGLERGGNVLGLERLTQTEVLCLIWLQVKGGKQAVIAEEKLANWVTAASEYAESLGKDSGWLYLNYAFGTQDPLKGYGHQNMRKIADATRKYDPNGVFQALVPGGFKISKTYSDFSAADTLNNRDEL